MEEKKLFYASIMTPYLIDSIEDMGSPDKPKCIECETKDTCELRKEMEEVSEAVNIEEQIERYGFDPDNLNGQRSIETSGFKVMLETKDEHVLLHPAMADFLIAGNTSSGEDAVTEMKPSGVLVARYSIFYDGPSDYTGNTPESAGYAFDMPKQVDVVKAFLRDDHMLEALLSRDENQIRDELAGFNEQSGLLPVIATPYLSEALQYEHPPAQVFTNLVKRVEKAMNVKILK